MNKSDLVNKIKEFISVKEKNLVEKTISVKDMSLKNLRDCIIGLGTILDEDFDNNIYVVSINAGVANMNNAIVAINIVEDKVLFIGYAQEGIINQHTAQKAIDMAIKRIGDYLL